jgi:signal peptidase
MRMSLRRAATIAVAAFLLSVLTTGVLAWKAGYRVYAVQTGSMVPTFRPGDLVVDRPVASGGYAPGDVITFRHSAAPDVVSHRMTARTAQGIHTKGDANRTADTWDIRPDQVEGVEVTALAHLGYLLVFLKQPTGDLGVMSTALSLVLLWGICFPPASPAATELEPEPAKQRARRPRRHLLQGA